MDYKIHNFAPDADIIEVVFYGSDNNKDKIVVTIDRDAYGTVRVSVSDKLEETDSRMVLGQKGFTDKL